MHSIEQSREGLALIAAGLGMLSGADWASVPLEDRLAVMETVETDRRLALAVSNAIAASVADEDFSVLGDTPKKLIADTVRITLSEAAGRLQQAELVRERLTFTGEVLEPHLPATAALWNEGLLDADHVAVIVKFFDEIPADTPMDVQESSEEFLAQKATELRPDQLTRLAKKQAQIINPDGKFSERDRRQKSGFRWTSVRSDGMSKGVIWATPELRANLDAFFAKYAAPGMCLPDEDLDENDQPSGGPAGPDAGAQNSTDEPDVPDIPTGAEPDVPVHPDFFDVAPHDAAAEAAEPDFEPEPVATPEPEPEPGAARTDYRTPGQRSHDALLFWMRSVLGNPALGTHHGLPLTLVVTVTLEELLRGAGFAITTGGTLIPMRDLIRMASKSYRFLEIFVDGDRRVLDLYRAKRCASGDQWLALFGRDRGCTKPNCDKPADATQAHHSPDYAADGQTNINMMGLACYDCHPQVKPGGWTTRMRGGFTEWEPPPQYPRKAPKTNDFHHPERNLREFFGDDDDEDHQPPG